jgi:hypothetical protein
MSGESRKDSVMKRDRERFAAFAVLLAAGWLLVVVQACTSRNAKASPKDKPSQPTAAAADHDFDGGTYCAQTFMQGPAPAMSLHFSNKVSESDESLHSKDYEADLTSDSLDVALHQRWLASDDDRKNNEELAHARLPITPIHDGYAEPVKQDHYTRSDASRWSMAVSSMVQGGTPWGLFIYKPTVTKVGTENINGYDTSKYSVDTTHQDQLDKAAGLMTGMKDYNITGTAWVFNDAKCVLQYDLVYEQDGKDGKVDKTHFEGTVTKKQS